MPNKANARTGERANGQTRSTPASMRLDLSASATQHLKDLVYDQGGTKRYHLLKALKKGGFPISADELIKDGRRGR